MLAKMAEKIKRSLVLKTTLIFLVAAIIPYIAATVLILNNSEKAIYKNIVKGLSSEVELLRDNVDARLFHLRNNASAWADLEVMDEVSTGDTGKRISHTLEELKTIYGLSGEIHTINMDGVIISSTNRSYIGRKTTAPWLNRLFSGAIIELDSHISEINGHKVITFGIPIRHHALKKRTIGGLIAEYEMKDIGMPSPPHAAIIDKNGEVITSSTGNSFLGKTRFYVPSDEKNNIIFVPRYFIAVAKSKGYYDFKGFGWTVAIAEKERIVRKPIVRVEQATVFFGLLGISLIITLVSFLSSRSIRPIKELSRTAEEIAKTKNLSLRVESSRGDEVGRLADAFNYMIEEVNSHINQIREMEEQMRRTESLSALGELSAGMAHEIKNPLGIIKSSADIIKEKSETDSQNGVLAAAISEEATRLAKILETFLQFARPRPPMMSPCRINEILERAVDLLSTDMSKGSIAISKRLDKTIPVIQSDLDQMYQVFVNIIINAIHAMPEGGRLEVATRMVSISEPSIEDRESGIISNDFIEISISDTGSGVHPEHKEKIFNPFFTTKEKGTGLGLAIVHGIVAKLGGHVKVEDGIPTGTCFKIYLPIEVIQ